MLKKLIETQSNSILTYRCNNVEELNKFYSISLENGENLVDIDGTILDKIGFHPSPEHTLISYHLNQVTPIRDLISDTFQKGYRAVKMAVSIDQDYEFFSLCREIALIRKEGRIISIVPMGTGSGIYRLISAITVSDFTYTKFGIETGEGQYDFRLFHEIKSNIKNNAVGNNQLF
ncbi:MAG: beta/alpha barrel domain-containing protein [Thermoplasmataceae archaeon]